MPVKYTLGVVWGRGLEGWELVTWGLETQVRTSYKQSVYMHDRATKYMLHQYSERMIAGMP